MDDKEAKEVKRYSRVMKKAYKKAPIDVKNCFTEAKRNREHTHYLKEDLSMDNIQQLEWNDDMKLRAADESVCLQGWMKVREIRHTGGFTVGMD